MNRLTIILTTIILAVSVSSNTPSGGDQFNLIGPPATTQGDTVASIGPPATSDEARCLSCGMERKPRR
jgi:hypothetical protein